MNEELKALDSWLAPLVSKLSPGERRKLGRSLAIGLRRRQASRIAAQQNPDGSSFEKRKPRKRDKSGRIRKQKKMFQNLRKVHHLKMSYDANHAAVGYVGIASRIAQIHQEGLIDRVVPGGPLFHYPVRKLLGFSQEDREWIFDQVKNSLSV